MDGSRSEGATCASPDHDLVLRLARSGRYPLRSPCPNGCRFCYERHLSRLIPQARLARLQPLTPGLFDAFLAEAQACGTLAEPSSTVEISPEGALSFFSFSDFFSQGLSVEQLERLLRHNAQYDPTPWLYTAGVELDADTVRQLCQRHAAAMRVYLSLFTFDDAIKRQLIPRWPGSGTVERVIPWLPSAIFYLTHFGCEQTLADLRRLDRLANRARPPTVLIARLHYDRLHPRVVRDLAEGGLAEFPRVVEHLVAHPGAFPNLGGIHFQHPSTAYAWRFRGFLAARLAPLALREGDAVLCSRAAFPVLERLLAGTGARVAAVADALGGSTDFATSVTTPRLVAGARGLRAEAPLLRRLVVPSSMWPWSGRCLAGGTVEDLRRELPGLAVEVVDVPARVLATSLSVDECWDYVNAGLDVPAS